MFIELINNEGEPFTVNLLQLKVFRPQGPTDIGSTILVVSDTGSVIANSPYDVVKARIAAMTK